MIRSLLKLEAIQPGFQTENVLTWRISASRTKYAKGPQVAAFYTELLQRLRSIPGVMGAAATTDVFLSVTPNSGSFTVEGRRPLMSEKTPESAQFTLVSQAEGRELTSRGAKLSLPSCE